MPTSAFHQKLQAFGQTIVELGCINAILYGADRTLCLLSAGRWSLYKYHFLAQAVTAAPLCRGRGKHIAVRLYRHRDELPPVYPRPDDVLSQRYGQGALSLAAFKDGQLAGFLWLLFGNYQEDEVRARYILGSAQSAWDF
ncbi:MAG TPA: hypothetical protein VGP06_11935, partial [Janthinobacterium sp.]|nr:hypothetical protein [Janthinobacterium sp.]